MNEKESHEATIKAAKLILECLELNKVPVSVGCNALLSLTLMSFSETWVSLEEVKEVVSFFEKIATDKK